MMQTHASHVDEYINLKNIHMQSSSEFWNETPRGDLHKETLGILNKTI